MERGSEAYVSREVMKLYGSHKLIAVNEMLPGQIEIDFHFKDEEGVDVFVEASNRRTERSMLSKILNLYSSISNIEPPLGKFKLIVIGRTVTSSMRKELERFPIRLLTFRDLGITQRKQKDNLESADCPQKRQVWWQSGRLKREPLFDRAMCKPLCTARLITLTFYFITWNTRNGLKG